MIREHELVCSASSAIGARHYLAVAARVGLIALALMGLMVCLADSALAVTPGPDNQPSPSITQRYTDIFGLFAWGVLFSILSVVLPVLGFFTMLGAGGAIFSGGAIYQFSEQIRLGRSLDPVNAAFHGLLTVLMTICIYLFVGPFGLYHWTIKPILIRSDQADATACCLPHGMPPSDLTVSNDGRWLLGYKSGSLTWGLSERAAAGRAYLVDTKAGAFVRFPGRNGERNAFWSIGEGVKKVGWLHEVNWDTANGRYLYSSYSTNNSNSLRSEKFDLQRLGLGPVRLEQPMPVVEESFKLLSHGSDEAVFQSSKRRISLPVGGETVYLDSSGTVAAVLAHDDESWIDRGTVTFWHVPSGKRIREYQVNYLPKDPSWKVAYGGAVWVYTVNEHIKIFRPLEGGTPDSRKTSAKR